MLFALFSAFGSLKIEAQVKTQCTQHRPVTDLLSIQSKVRGAWCGDSGPMAGRGWEPNLDTTRFLIRVRNEIIECYATRYMNPWGIVHTSYASIQVCGDLWRAYSSWRADSELRRSAPWREARAAAASLVVANSTNATGPFPPVISLRRLKPEQLVSHKPRDPPISHIWRTSSSSASRMLSWSKYCLVSLSAMNRSVAVVRLFTVQDTFMWWCSFSVVCTVRPSCGWGCWDISHKLGGWSPSQLVSDDILKYRQCTR